MSDARLVGRLLAERGCVTLTGGVAAGVMAAAAAGASAVGGLAIGVLPGADGSDAASGLTVALPTGLGEARNAVLVTAADGVIGCGINPGTASELALALRARKPTALVRPDGATAAFFGALAADAPVHVADTPEDAVAWVVGRLAASDAERPR